jgi:tRNA(adenine34) deaminase
MRDLLFVFVISYFTMTTSFIKKALAQARIAAQNGEVPVGAVLVKDRKIIAETYNLVETRKDPTAHAEILAIRAATEILNSPRLTDCDLYVTLEPCAMCAQAIAFARIRRLYFGAYDEKGGGVENGARIFSQPTCNHQPEIYGGIAESECGELLRDFFQGKR